MKYEEVYKDWRYLWDIGPAYDMTGGYVDSEDLDRIFAKPTKTMIKKCLADQINYWFHVGVEGHGFDEVWLQKTIEEDAELKTIAVKYGFAEEEWEE